MTSVAKALTDYARSGLDIQSAMVEQIKNQRPKDRQAPSILWDGREVHTSYRMSTPKKGRFRLTFLSQPGAIIQGVDIRVTGTIDLGMSGTTNVLRTWHDGDLGDTYEYEFVSSDGSIFVWNVYRHLWKNGSTTEEKWIGNSGFWIENLDESTRIFHCSPGSLEKPDFESFRFQLSIEER